jgi:hypothetical protein
MSDRSHLVAVETSHWPSRQAFRCVPSAAAGSVVIGGFGVNVDVVAVNRLEYDVVGVGGGAGDLLGEETGVSDPQPTANAHKSTAPRVNGTTARFGLTARTSSDPARDWSRMSKGDVEAG